ncbi:MAG: YidB family protein [Ferribacterium limneticum]
MSKITSATCSTKRSACAKRPRRRRRSWLPSQRLFANIHNRCHAAGLGWPNLIPSGEQIMGLLDSVVGALAGGQSGGDSPLLNIVMQLINNPQTGGLGGLVQSFQQGGLGNIVNSWVSTGQNLPISAEQIQAVLGGGQLQNIATQLGMSTEQASGGLADLLPQVVDKLTPNGQVPEGGDLLAQGLDMLKKGGLFS